MSTHIKISSLTASVRYQLRCFYTCIWVENGLKIYEMTNELSIVDADNENFKGSDLIKRLLQYDFHTQWLTFMMASTMKFRFLRNLECSK